MAKVQICKSDKCTGCALCSVICPKKAITMVYDNEGFTYPEINDDRCIKCGLCTRQCIANNKPKFYVDNSDFYLCWAKDKSARKMGSSGGMFSAIAKWVLSEGGEVAGAGFVDDLRLLHYIADSNDALIPLYGSKYIQSDVHEIYKIIKDKLLHGKLILFVGTPCQVAALYSYCGYSDNLITCDLICYGVGSKSFFDACIQDLEQRFNSKAIDVKFRNKVYGCRNSNFTVQFNNEKKYSKIFFLSNYGIAFSGRLINRRSCYDCTFSSSSRMGDFTLGDYTSSDIINVNLHDVKRGLSLLRVNSEKGKRIFTELSELICFEKKEENTIMNNSVRQKNEKIDMTRRNNFLTDFYESGFSFTVNKYCKPSVKRKLKLRYDLEYLLIKKIYKKLPIFTSPKNMNKL